MPPSTDTPATTPPSLAAVRSASQLSQGATTTLLVLRNFHRFLNSTEIIQAIERQVSQGKHTRTFIVIVAPVVNLPPEIEKQFLVIEHELPGGEQLREIATGVAQGDELPAEEDLARVLDSASGLTRYEAEGAFSLSIVRHGRLVPSCIWDVKSQQLKKSGLVSLHRGTERFDQLGGLENLKAFCLRAMRRQGEPHPGKRPRGVLLLSPPGCGKSQFAKALGNETGRPTVIFTEFFDRFRRLNVRSNPELDALVDQARQVITGIEPQQLRDSVRLRAMVANDFTRIEQAVGDLLVDRPRRNILRRAGAGSGGAA